MHKLGNQVFHILRLSLSPSLPSSLHLPPFLPPSISLPLPRGSPIAWLCPIWRDYQRSRLKKGLGLKGLFIIAIPPFYFEEPLSKAPAFSFFLFFRGLMSQSKWFIEKIYKYKLNLEGNHLINSKMNKFH